MSSIAERVKVIYICHGENHPETHVDQKYVHELVQKFEKTRSIVKKKKCANNFLIFYSSLPEVTRLHKFHPFKMQIMW